MRGASIEPEEVAQPVYKETFKKVKVGADGTRKTYKQVTSSVHADVKSSL